jgi:GNAT superfamily N-acetyltransferase
MQYTDERDMPMLQRLIDSELSEPYSVFTYRYFLHPWPSLCYFCYVDNEPVGVVVCKIDDHRGTKRGYLGMLVVQKNCRKLGIGTLRSVPIRDMSQGLSLLCQHQLGLKHSKLRRRCCTANQLPTADYAQFSFCMAFNSFIRSFMAPALRVCCPTPS